MILVICIVVTAESTAALAGYSKSWLKVTPESSLTTYLKGNHAFGFFLSMNSVLRMVGEANFVADVFTNIASEKAWNPGCRGKSL